MGMRPRGDPRRVSSQTHVWNSSLPCRAVQVPNTHTAEIGGRGVGKVTLRAEEQERWKELRGVRAGNASGGSSRLRLRLI